MAEVVYLRAERLRRAEVAAAVAAPGVVAEGCERACPAPVEPVGPSDVPRYLADLADLADLPARADALALWWRLVADHWGDPAAAPPDLWGRPTTVPLDLVDALAAAVDDLDLTERARYRAQLRSLVRPGNKGGR